jgi:hypothetical protein
MTRTTKFRTRSNQPLNELFNKASRNAYPQTLPNPTLVGFLPRIKKVESQHQLFK